MRKKGSFVVMLSLALVMLLCACGGGSGGIQSKWYMMNDDDFWMEIGGSSIQFYSVHTDELVATADASISGNEIVVSNVAKLTKGARSLPEGTFSYQVDGDKLTLSLGGSEETFSTDISYKRDH